MPPESMTQALWRQARSGDALAREKLFALHTHRLLIFVRSRMGKHLRERVEPEDILQDAYAAAVRDFGDFDYTDNGAFVRWMCRIIDNRLRDAHDRYAAGKRQEQPLPHSAPTGPVTAFQRTENEQRIETALALLSDEHREVLLLRYFQGLTAEEVGERMHRSSGAVRSLAARALVELGKHLDPTSEPRP